mmetsp:Transcript_76104/g.149325  ORF Transcript_76104/g.149325 Transcript_76104/m.149325 type:complete len:90 (+) Transcript_76104:234-503(+)
MFRRSFATSNAEALSNALVGSSRKSTEGRLTKASAMLKRFRWPPERPFLTASPARVPSHDLSPMLSTTSCTNMARCLAHIPWQCSSAQY